MRVKRPLFIGLIAGLACSANAAKFLPYDEPYNKYPAAQAGWDSALSTHWKQWKTDFLNNGLVKGTDPSGASKTISEGQAYAMLMSVWMNDQATFNSVWAALENNLWNSSSSWYKWTPSDQNYAGDADQDICGALIFASALVDKGHWTSYSTGGNTYKSKAKIVLQSIIKNFIDVNSGYRINSWPGAGDGIRNPSYHMPQWYPIFKDFGDSNGISGMDWTKAAAGAYAFIKAQPNSSKGLARNFSSATGGTPSGGTSSPNNFDMGFDAIRVPYRMGMAAIWHKDADALSWCKGVWSGGVVSSASPGMYSISSSKLCGWKSSNSCGDGWDTYAYETPMTEAMWGTAARGSAASDASSQTAFTAITSLLGAPLKQHPYFTTYDDAPQTNYFAQSLALLGCIAMNGRAWNVWDDLKHPTAAADTATKMTTALSASPSSSTTTGTIRVTGKLNKSVPWTLTMTGATSGASYVSLSFTTDTIDFQWTPSSMRKLKAFATENATIVLTVDGRTDLSGSTTTVALTAAVGIHGQSVRGAATAWTSEGLRVSSQVAQPGQAYLVRVFNLQGQQVQQEQMVMAQEMGGTTLLSAAPPLRQSGMLFVELQDAQGAKQRLLLPPVH